MSRLQLIELQPTTDLCRPHQCTYCGKRFKRKDHKVEHERIHTGERPYTCSMCARSFVQKQQLVSHKRRRHNIFPSDNSGSSEMDFMPSSFHHFDSTQQQSYEHGPEQRYRTTPGENDTELLSGLMDEHDNGTDVRHRNDPNCFTLQSTSNSRSSLVNRNSSIGTVGITSGNPMSDEAPLTHLAALVQSPRATPFNQHN